MKQFFSRRKGFLFRASLFLTTIVLLVAPLLACTAAAGKSFKPLGPNNNPPTAADFGAVAFGSYPKPILLKGSDPDGNQLRYITVKFPAHGTLSGTAPNLRYTAAPGFEGTDTFIYQVNDGERDSAPATVTLTVVKDPFSANLNLDSDRDGVSDLRVSADDTVLTVLSQGWPNHPTATFPNSRNPNSIRKQNFTFRIPTNPAVADRITGLPMGPIGVALNGIPFFNPFNAEGQVAVDGYSEEWLDACCGHPDQRGVYHYHKYPVCSRSPFKDKGQAHSPVIGFAFDGFPIYGPYESKGVMARDLKGESALDECNGHTDTVRGYHYHVTPNKFPFILGAYRGTPETSNNPMIRVGQGSALKAEVVGSSPYDSMIASVKPPAVELGSTQVITVELANVGVPESIPSKVAFGPYVGTNVTRNGMLVTAQVTIPADDGTNVYDVHLEFSGGNSPAVIRKKNSFSVVETINTATFTLEPHDPVITLNRGKSSESAMCVALAQGYSGKVTITPPTTLPARLKITPATLTTSGGCVDFKVKSTKLSPAGSYDLLFTSKDDQGLTQTVTITIVIKD
ncbi:MAG: YHYH protein [Blastocatellia bacterium]|nr:YHYH protein [Blastocatellia bacterium]